jgi:ABC-type multidrug transport system fused ATPase/permease subunit
VNADAFIEKLPKGYLEEVQERGGTLSLGQKQLISFARVLAYDPKIVILDEATSSVDTETELLIRNAFSKLIKGRTSIIIAHRLSTIKYVDKIMVIDKGEIAEMGNHEELLAKKGIYRDLHQLQFGR